MILGVSEKELNGQEVDGAPVRAHIPDFPHFSRRLLYCSLGRGRTAHHGLRLGRGGDTVMQLEAITQVREAV